MSHRLKFNHATILEQQKFLIMYGMKIKSIFQMTIRGKQRPTAWRWPLRSPAFLRLQVNNGRVAALSLYEKGGVHPSKLTTHSLD